MNGDLEQKIIQLESRLKQLEKDAGFQLKFPVDAITKRIIKDLIPLAGFTSKARAYRGTSVQSIPNTDITKVELNAENYDVDEEFDSTTNYRFTATDAGYYLVCAQCRLDTGVDTKFVLTIIAVDGVYVSWNQAHMSSASPAGAFVSDIVYLGSGGYVELFIRHNSGAASNLSEGTQQTFMSIHRLS